MIKNKGCMELTNGIEKGFISIGCMCHSFAIANAKSC